MSEFREKLGVNRISEYDHDEICACAKAIATVYKDNQSQQADTSKGRERTSEWLNETNILPIPLSSAAFLASPCNVTSGAPVSPLGRISMSCMAALAPLERTPRDLNTASLPAQRAANEAGGDAWELQ
jgi:hypothetical protein